MCAVRDIALSPREREVAALVASGLSNREIGERLFIAERTAEGHLEQIRNKLGFHSRSQVAAWAVSNGLVAGKTEDARPPRARSEERRVGKEWRWRGESARDDHNT